MKKTPTGFTLIELLVVIAMIGILSTIGLLALNGARQKARDAQRRTDLAQLRSAIVLYYDDFRAYPPSGEVERASATTTNVTALGGLFGTTGYLAAAPVPPDGPGTLGDEYESYVYDNNGSRYTIYVRAESATAGPPAAWYWVNDRGQGGKKVTPSAPTCGNTPTTCPST